MASEDNTNNTWGTTKCKKFSGTYTEYDEWKTKFVALAEIKGYAKYYERNIVIVKREEIDSGLKEGTSTALTDNEKNEYAMKVKAWAFLIMHLTGTPFSIVNEHKSDTYKGMKTLNKKYEVSQQDVTESLKEVTTQWQQNVLTCSMDPDDYFTRITTLNEKFKTIKREYKKDDDLLVAHILANLPDEYREFRLQMAVHENLTLKNLKKYMRSYWFNELGGREILREDTEENEKKPKSELALNTEESTGTRFNGKCNYCGKRGHKEKDCFKKKKDNGNLYGESGRFAKFNGKCNYCGKKGHKEANCWEKYPDKKPEKFKKAQEANEVSELFCGSVATLENDTVKKGSWMGDTGATGHMTWDESELTDLEDTNVPITVANGGREVCRKKGKLLGCSKYGEPFQLHDVYVVPGLKKKLISLTKLTSSGATMKTGKDKLVVKKAGKNLTFDLKNEDGKYLYYLELESQEAHDIEVEKEDKNMDKKFVRKMDINVAHGYCHSCESVLRKNYAREGIELVGELRACEGCNLAKGKAKNINKSSTKIATMIGERIYVDTSGPFEVSSGGSRYWFEAVDEFSRYGWCGFAKTKDEIDGFYEDVCKWFDNKGIKMKYLRCDNAGENIKQLKNVANKYGIEMEYTAPNTPQFNGIVERRFAVLTEKAKAMMTAAKLTSGARKLLWAEAVNTANYVYNIMIPAKRDKSPYLLMWGKESPRFRRLVEFGRIGYVAVRTKIKRKMAPKAFKAIMIGYSMEHSSDTYRMFNPKTRKVFLSRDVVWSDWEPAQPSDDMPVKNEVEASNNVKETQKKKVRFKDKVEVIENKAEEEEEYVTVGDEERRSAVVEFEPDELGEPEEENENENIIESSRISNVSVASKNSGGARDPKHQSIARNTRSKVAERIQAGRSVASNTRSANKEPAVREGKYVVTGEVEAKNIIPAMIEADEDEFVHLVCATEVNSDVGEPQSYQEAKNNVLAHLWKQSMTSEINNFINRNVWIPTKLEKVRKLGRKPIPVKWVFKVKDEANGDKRLKCRAVVKGFHMIPGVDYTEKFSPVTTDTSTRVMLGLTMYYRDIGWVCEMFDVEAAFLESDVETECYVEWPEGIVDLGFMTQEEADTTCAMLNKAMYGQVDAALLWLRTFGDYLETKCGMKQSKVDPCIFYKKDEKTGELLLILSIHVDDVIVAGMAEHLEDLKVKIKERFNITDLGQLKKHLGVNYEWGTDEEGDYVKAEMKKNAEKFINCYEKMFEKNVKVAKTPGFPGKCLNKNEGEVIMLDEYRSLVGQIMFYMVKVGPDVANAARELAQHMTNPGEEHWNSMERMVGYMKGKEFYGIILRKPKYLKGIDFCDANYATNIDNRKSVSGALNTIGGMVTGWSSKTQHTTSLSTTESEYISMSHCIQDTKFRINLLNEVTVHENPAIIFEDNEGAIFLAKNQQVSMRTKHIDVRAHYIRDCIKDKSIVVKKIKTENNVSDIMTKNCDVATVEKHNNRILNGKIECVQRVEGRMSD